MTDSQSRRLLEIGFKVATLPVGQEPVLSTKARLATYPVNVMNANLVIWRSDLVAVRVRLDWACNPDEVAKVEALLVGSAAPCVTAPTVHRTWLLSWADPLHAVRSGRLFGLAAEVIAADGPGIIAPPSRLPGRTSGLVPVAWEDEENVEPAPVPAALVAEFKRSGLLSWNAGGGWSVTPVTGSPASVGA